MDTINYLVDKLYQQKQENASPAHLLFTVQLLQAELVKLQQRNGSIGIRKVSVTLPSNSNFAEEVVREAFTENKKAPEPFGQTVNTIEQPIKQEPIQEVQNEQREYFLRKPVLEVEPTPVKEEIKEPVKTHKVYQPVLNPAFDFDTEIQPLNRYEEKQEFKPIKENSNISSQRAKELHELIGVQQESLNDRLKEEKTELAHVLKATPIKDLKKAIGINERFTLVNDLFKGDDLMYERSIKTINNFHIFSEAEYWINRELKVRLAWDDDSETVQHFYELVRRRFS
ncbi:MAG: hypothetical protein ACM3VS_01280 [Candidatus Dadabacteria bacterium]